MTFKIRTVSFGYPQEQEDIELLSKIGLNLHHPNQIIDIEINSLEELLELCNIYPIIIEKDKSILIYDDYIE